MSFISLQDIHKTYAAGYQALRGVDLDIAKGEFVAMMGPSGSGKSTMANILGCLDSPSSGKYFFNGVEVSALNRTQRAYLRRFYRGFIFQGFNLLSSRRRKKREGKNRYGRPSKSRARILCYAF